ncbi:MAG TPA: Rieske 2Fe-2S domain-containing protein, partial [Candidatus Humimicrobiaceae bacterium]
EAAKKDSIPEGSMKAFKIQEKDILVVNYKGSFYAIGSKCTHMKGDLSKGVLEGNIVRCPRHGSKFDITTGENISGPKIGLLKLKTPDEPVFEVKIEGGSIMVDI